MLSNFKLSFLDTAFFFCSVIESTTLLWARFLRVRSGKKLSIICRHTIPCWIYCRLHFRICCGWWKQARMIEWKWANTSHFIKVFCKIKFFSKFLDFQSLLLWIFKNILTSLIHCMVLYQNYDIAIATYMFLI